MSEHQFRIPLTIYYGGVQLSPGDLLTTGIMEKRPRFEWPGDSTKFYTLIMVDVSDPFSPYLYLLDINIPGNNINAATDIVQYPPPKIRIPPDSPPHRFQVLLAEQPSKMDPQEVNDFVISRNFNVELFIDIYDLTPVGKVEFEVMGQQGLPPPEIINTSLGPVYYFNQNA